MERAKHMELPPVGKYKTSGGEYIHPADVLYEAQPVDDEAQPCTQEWLDRAGADCGGSDDDCPSDLTDEELASREEKTFADKVADAEPDDDCLESCSLNEGECPNGMDCDMPSRQEVDAEPDVDAPNGVHHTTELSAYGTTLKSRVRVVIIDREGLPITALADRIEEELNGTTVITGAVCDAESIAQECMENMFQGVQFKIGHDANGDFLQEWNGKGKMWNEFRQWVTGYIKIARIKTKEDIKNG